MTDDSFDDDMTPIPGLGDLAPEPGADYWSSIDAGLQAIESESDSQPGSGSGQAAADAPTAAVSESVAGSDDPRPLTEADADLIRLDDMRNQTNPTTWRPTTQSILTIAAVVLILLLGGAALINLLGGEDETPVSLETADEQGGNDLDGTDLDGTDLDGTGQQSSEEDIDDSGDDSADFDSTGGADATADENSNDDASTDGSTGDDDETSPGVATASASCWTFDSSYQLVTEIDEDGVLRAASDSQSSGRSTAVGRFVAGSDDTMIVWTTDAAGATVTALWFFNPERVTQGEGDIGSKRADCVRMPLAAELFDSLPAATLPEAGDPVLAAGSRTCWSLAADTGWPINDYYEILVADGGRATVRSFAVDDGVASFISSGSGSFISSNELVTTGQSWGPVGGSTPLIELLTIADDGSLFVLAPNSDWHVEPAACDDLDANVRPGVDGFDIGVDEEIRFASGTSSGTVEDAVVRGTRNLHRFEANAGQTASIAISSLEDNGVFDLIGPDGEWLARETVAVALELPFSGDYIIVTGGTRGNATYTLDLTIN